jgi:hypothetical protein
MRFIVVLIALLWACTGCSKDKTNPSATASASSGRQLKIGMQEVHFSQISAVEGWGFADINQAKTLFAYMDDLKVSRFRYTIFWTSAELYAKNNFVWTRHDELIQYLTNKNIALTVTLFRRPLSV